MTSNSRASRAGLAAPSVLTACVALAALLVARPADAEPPFPALAGASVPSREIAVATPTASQRVRITGARILTREPETDRVRAILSGGPDARGGAIIAVDVAEPFRQLDRTASPAVLLDGQLLDSFVSGENLRRVYALVPLRLMRATAASVQVGWLGDLERTISSPVRAPLR